MPVQNIQMWPDWKIVRELGRGSFGEVYEIHRQNGSYLEKAAMKVIRIPSSQAELMQLRADGLRMENTEQYYSKQVEDIRNEIGIMSRFVGYSNIVSYEDYMIRKHEGEIGWDILIRMELLTALSNYLVSHTMPEEQVVQLGLDISQALMICHKAGIVHRDIKPQNVFINNMGFFKLGDFGISRALPTGTNVVMSFKGSIAYMAPETFSMRKADARSDIYSLALVLYRCLNGGREPFLNSGAFGPGDQEIAQRRRLSGEAIPRPERCSNALWKVLSVSLAPNPAARHQSAGEFHDALLGIVGGTAGERQLRRISPIAGSVTGGMAYRNQAGNGMGTDGRNHPPTSRNAYQWGNTGTGFPFPPNYQQNSGSQNRQTFRGGQNTQGAPNPVSMATAPDRPNPQAVSQHIEQTRGGRPVAAVASVYSGKPSSGGGRGKSALLAVCIAAALLLAVTGVWMMLHPSGSDDSNTSAIADSGIQSMEMQEISSVKSVIAQEGTGTGTENSPNRGPVIGEGMEEAVSFADSALKSAVCDYLGIGDREVTRGDALGVSTLELSGESRDASEKITDLTGLSAFENLEVLDLKENNVTDVTELGSLTELERLDLSKNHVADITPLESLDSLEWLDLMDNEVSSISPITSLSHIYMLDISGNQISDISGISGITELMALLMDGNDISNIGPLKGLSGLVYLTFGENHVRDVSVLSEFEDLEALFMYNNEIEDVSVLRKLKNLTDLAYFGNPIEDFGPIEDLGDSVEIYEP